MEKQRPQPDQEAQPSGAETQEGEMKLDETVSDTRLTKTTEGTFSATYREFIDEKNSDRKKELDRNIEKLWEKRNPGKSFRHTVEANVRQELRDEEPMPKKVMSERDFRKRELPKTRIEIESEDQKKAEKIVLDSLPEKEKEKFYVKQKDGSPAFDESGFQNYLEQKRKERKIEKPAFYRMISQGVRVDSIAQRGFFKRWFTWKKEYEIKVEGGESMYYSNENKLVDDLNTRERVIEQQIRDETNQRVEEKVKTGKEELKQRRTDQKSILIQEEMRKDEKEQERKIKLKKVGGATNLENLHQLLGGGKEDQEVRDIEATVDKYIKEHGVGKKSIGRLRKYYSPLLGTIADKELRLKVAELLSRKVEREIKSSRIESATTTKELHEALLENENQYDANQLKSKKKSIEATIRSALKDGEITKDNLGQLLKDGEAMPGFKLDIKEKFIEVVLNEVNNFKLSKKNKDSKMSSGEKKIVSPSNKKDSSEPPG